MKQDEYSTARPNAGATEVKQLNPGGPWKQTQSVVVTRILQRNNTSGSKVERETANWLQLGTAIYFSMEGLWLLVITNI